MWEEPHSAHTTQAGGHDQRVSGEFPPASGLDAIAIIARRNRGEEIHGPERRDDYWYHVKSGAAKCYVVLPGGRRQILDLLLPNDFFGSPPCSGHYFSLEAVVNETVVACYPRKRAEALAVSDPKVAREVLHMESAAVSRLQELLLILGRTTAREKVGSFLLNMVERSSKQTADRVVLHMSRYDIADYLALSVETVSRSLTDLRHRGLIALTGPRRVKIVNRHGLEDRGSCGSMRDS